MILKLFALLVSLTVSLNEVNCCYNDNDCCPVAMDCGDARYGCFDVRTLLYIVDTGGIGATDDFDNLVSALHGIAENVHDSDGSYLYGAVSFADTYQVLGFQSTPDHLVNIPKVDGSVDFSVGINAAVDLLQTAPGPKICVFVTSSTSTGSSSDLTVAAADLQMKCNRVMVIAITADVDVSQLQLLAPDPADRFSLLDFGEIINEINLSKVTLCVDPPPPDCLYELDIAMVFDVSSFPTGDLPSIASALASMISNTKFRLDTMSITGRSSMLNMALVTFGKPKLNFNFSPVNKVLAKMNTLPLLTGTSDFGAAIKFTNNKVLGSSSDSGSPNVCIFVTAGSNEGSAASLSSAVTTFQNNCDKVLAISVSEGITENELLLITGDADNTFGLFNFDEIVNAIVATAETVCFRNPINPANCNIFHRSDQVSKNVKAIYKTASETVTPAIELCNELEALSMEQLPVTTETNVANLQTQINELKNELKKGEAIIFKGIMKRIKKWINKLKKLLSAIKDAIEKLWDGLTKKEKRMVKKLKKLFGKKLLKLILRLLKILGRLLILLL